MKEHPEPSTSEAALPPLRETSQHHEARHMQIPEVIHAAFSSLWELALPLFTSRPLSSALYDAHNPLGQSRRQGLKRGPGPQHCTARNLQSFPQTNWRCAPTSCPDNPHGEVLRFPALSRGAQCSSEPARGSRASST